MAALGSYSVVSHWSHDPDLLLQLQDDATDSISLQEVDSLHEITMRNHIGDAQMVAVTTVNPSVCDLTPVAKIKSHLCAEL